MSEPTVVAKKFDKISTRRKDGKLRHDAPNDTAHDTTTRTTHAPIAQRRHRSRRRTTQTPRRRRDNAIFGLGCWKNNRRRERDGREPHDARNIVARVRRRNSQASCAERAVAARRRHNGNVSEKDGFASLRRTIRRRRLTTAPRNAPNRDHKRNDAKMRAHRVEPRYRQRRQSQTTRTRFHVVVVLLDNAPFACPLVVLLLLLLTTVSASTRIDFACSTDSSTRSDDDGAAK